MALALACVASAACVVVIACNVVTQPDVANPEPTEKPRKTLMFLRFDAKLHNPHSGGFRM